MIELLNLDMRLVHFCLSTDMLLLAHAIPDFLGCLHTHVFSTRIGLDPLFVGALMHQVHGLSKFFRAAVEGLGTLVSGIDVRLAGVRFERVIGCSYLA